MGTFDQPSHRPSWKSGPAQHSKKDTVRHLESLFPPVKLPTSTEYALTFRSVKTLAQ